VSGEGRVPWDVRAKLEDRTGVLSAALDRWDSRAAGLPDAEARRAATTAVNQIDMMLAELYRVRARLINECRISDDAMLASPHGGDR